MGSFANSLFRLMLGWLQTAVSAVWTAFTNQNGNSLFNLIGKHWILIAGVLCAIGLAADLCVYLLRRKQSRKHRPFYDETVQRPYIHAPQDEETVTEPDLSQWEPEEATQEMPYAAPEERPAMITKAGYVVPQDSPYRKPAEEKKISRTETQTETQAAVPAGIRRGDPEPIIPRRRRRINVSELFSDPEEELRTFEAPQHVIDSKSAYHDPVYPRGWKSSEDKAE